ncbi:hypothetical protein V6N12_050876 [Hibiscus sabdariffa]|uniref:Uncharacterized protein n=1 Tax=Hibiscus sabdariffa TaxID=183260 RepID=A0ABR2GEI1_9ROSI
MGLYTSLARALELEYNIDYNLRSLNKSNFIRTELLSAETCTPRDYSDPIASLIEFPSLPRPRISADVRFSADVFSAYFWVFSLGVASVQLPSLSPAAFEFCQGRSVLDRLPEITNKLATVPFYHKICNIYVIDLRNYKSRKYR